MKALEKDRARRYETANGLAMDIERYLGQQPVASRNAIDEHIAAANTSAGTAIRSRRIHHCRRHAWWRRCNSSTGIVISAGKAVLRSQPRQSRQGQRAASLGQWPPSKPRPAAQQKIANSATQHELWRAEQKKVREALAGKSAALDREQMGAYGHNLISGPSRVARG